MLLKRPSDVYRSLCLRRRNDHQGVASRLFRTFLRGNLSGSPRAILLGDRTLPGPTPEAYRTDRPSTRFVPTMPQAVNGFDVFDTLIARRSVEPHRVLRRLEAHTGLMGLAAARLAADRHLGARGQPYTLRDIWNAVAAITGLDAATTDRLLDLEIRLEHDEVIPIAENLAQVRDGDLLVSDTYLPPDIVRSLLRRAGLQRQVALVVSNDGKFTGRVWPRLLAAVAIRQHLGDNPHSDGRTPSAAGIPAVIYTGAQRTPVEVQGRRLCHGALCQLSPVGGVVDASQVLDVQGTCVVFISTPPRRHRILFQPPKRLRSAHRRATQRSPRCQRGPSSLRQGTPAAPATRLTAGTRRADA
jgi:hypothetical protein